MDKGYKPLRETHWSEWVNVLQINPDAADTEDVARLATELFEANQKIALIEQEQNAKCELCEKLFLGLNEALTDKVKSLQKQQKPMVEALKEAKDQLECVLCSANPSGMSELLAKIDAVLQKGEGK